MRVGIVAGEASGDRLAAGLIRALKHVQPDLTVEGIAGPLMVEAGCRSLFPMERLSVMGLVEVLGRYRELLGVRRQVREFFLANPPDVFIGVDAPDFNLGLEAALRRRGIPTVHYVSPAVWAWREYRVRKIARACDLMLTVFPFEESFYRRHHVNATFVGHSLADEIPLTTDQAAARRDLGLPVEGELVALLPGSRANELHYHVKPFIDAALWIEQRRPGVRFAVPLVNDAARQIFEEARKSLAPALPMALFDGRSHEVMAASDVVLMASGTAALEAMLLKRPMVVAYRMAPVTYYLLKLMVRLPYVSLPNLLAGHRLVPEFIQQEMTPAALGSQVLEWLGSPEAVKTLQREFASLHTGLRREASNAAARAVLELIGA